MAVAMAVVMAVRMHINARRRANSDARDRHLRSIGVPLLRCSFAVSFDRLFFVPAERADVLLGILRKMLPKDMVRLRRSFGTVRSALTGDGERVLRCYARTRPNGERTTAVTMDTSPTSCDLANLALQPDECSRQRGGVVPRTWLGSGKSTIYATRATDYCKN